MKMISLTVIVWIIVFRHIAAQAPEPGFKNFSVRTNPMHYKELQSLSERWKKRFSRFVGLAGDKSPWWSFAYEFASSVDQWISDLQEGKHQFDPIKQLHFGDGKKYRKHVVQVWSYRDRFMLHLLHQILKPTFKHVISSRCIHPRGPTSIKGASQDLMAALGSGEYQYFCRLDIKSYYASIDHKILLGQINKHYDDPIILKYLEDIVTSSSRLIRRTRAEGSFRRG